MKCYKKVFLESELQKHMFQFATNLPPSWPILNGRAIEIMGGGGGAWNYLWLSMKVLSLHNIVPISLLEKFTYKSLSWNW